MSGAKDKDCDDDKAHCAAAVREFTTAVYEEGVELSPFTQAITAWLQLCFEHLEAGEEDRIPCDPFYASRLAQEQIDAAIEVIDAEYDREWGGFPGYHRNRQGCDGPTGFYRLSAQGRRALVEGLQRIVVAYQDPPEQIGVPTSTTPDEERIAYG